MEYKWLNNKDGNHKVIVFFNGWGMDEYFVSHLDCEDYDVLMFYNYCTLTTDFDFGILNKYSERYLVAWSMGVMTATLFDINYTKKIAINGTLKPIDNNYGIPDKIYNLTLNNFNSSSIERFIKNMLDYDCENLKINRKPEEQMQELKALKSYQANMQFHYDKIILASNDKIIPTKNQIAYWNLEPNVQSGHSPFHLFKYWRELL